MIDTEILRQKYSPDGSPLRNSQMKMLEVMMLIDKICRDNHLVYFLSGGSALGAERHNGFIPWDDDLDITLPKKDFNQLVSILRELDSDRYVFQDRHTDFNYVNCFPKFREKEGNLLGSCPQRGKLYKYKGVGVDIFCAAKNSFIRAFVCNKLKVALLHYTYLIKNDTLRKLVTKIQWGVYLFLVPLTWPLNVFRKKGEMHNDLGQGFPKQYLWEFDIFPVAVAPFENVMLPVPRNQDAYLTSVYGNWRQVPSDEEIAKAVHNSDFRSNKLK